MRALVVGATGHVGTALLRVLRDAGVEAVGTHRSRRPDTSVRLDVRDEQAVRAYLARLEPDVVFLAVNVRGGVDHCEDHPHDAHALNVQGTENVASSAAARGIKLVYYSTDYVFDGESGPYSEEDQPNPVNVYGRTKEQAEEKIRALTSNHLILRTTAVFGWDPGSRNVAMQIWERLRSGRPMQVPEDQWCNPTLVDYAAEAAWGLVQAGGEGIFNLVGRDRVPRSELAKALARSMDLDPALVVPVPTSRLGQRAARPLQGGLSTRKLRAALGSEPPSLTEALTRFRRRWRAGTEVTSVPGSRD